MKNRVVIGGRYQYSPIQVLKETDTYMQYRAYDKVTKRDLELQIHKDKCDMIEQYRDLKNPFVQTIFDVVPLQDDTQIAIFFESAVQANLQQALRNNHYIRQNDAMVILKYALLAFQDIHDKMIVSGRICPENIAFCNYSLIKFCFNVYDYGIPIQTKSPEVLRGNKPTFASDIFSLGTILYRMLYGCYPFEGEDQDQLLSKIKSKKMKKNETVSPFHIIISKQAHFLLVSMLDYYPQNRPTVEQLLENTLFSFHVDVELQQYIKPKGSIIPEPFLKKYLVFRSSKLVDRIDEYYQQISYLALNIKNKQFVTMYTPDVKMFETDPRKIQSYFQKLRALKQSYSPDNCRFLCKIDDYERFRREPVLVTQYCNQGDLQSYLQKRSKISGWLSEKEINILMYLMALGYKQIRDIGVTSIHTIHSKKIMIKDHNIKIRQPGIITPFLQNKLFKYKKIDYFAPQLKNKGEYVSLDKSDMWSFGMLFYYLLNHSLPQLQQNDQFNGINIENLQTHRKNRNLIGKCLNPDSTRRIDLNQVKIEGVNESLLEEMLEQKFQQQNIDDEESEVAQQNLKKNVIFKSRKKKWCKNYNKIIAFSSTSPCRKWIKLLIGLILIWILSFGLFFINGGIGMLRTNYYRPIQLDVPYNYGTQLYTITILSTDGRNIQQSYSTYSYEQFTVDLNCTQNYRTANATATVDQYVNGSGHLVQCVFGFIYMIVFSILYGIASYRMDLPRILVERKAKGTNSELYHLILMYFIYIALLFCFFYIFALEYQMQMYPCLGIQNQDYPSFTSIQTLLTGDIGTYFSHVFTTVILWSIIMLIFSYLSLFLKKLKNNIFDFKAVIPTVIIMIVYTVICRIGFGTDVPLQPTWSYQMNMDINSNYWALLGFFPEILIISIFILERLIDVIFWFFLRLGMQPEEEADISRIQINMKLEPQEQILEKDINKNQSKVGLIDNDFEIFD